MALSFGDFIRTQLITEIPKPSTSFTSKTVVITGASSGIGLEAVRHVVVLGAAKVILACRDTAKGSQAKIDIETSTHCSPDILEVWKVDLESYDSVKEFANRANKLERLDVLVCNAGIGTRKFKIIDGIESTIVVNVISTFLMAFMLIPKLEETAHTYGVVPTLTFTTSALYSAAQMPDRQPDLFSWLGEEENVDMKNQ
jgi:retinol dehydrogenase-12